MKDRKKDFKRNFGNKNNKRNSGNEQPDRKATIVRLVLMLVLFAGVFYFMGGNNNSRQVTWYKFKNEMLAEQEVERVVVANRDRAEIFLKENALEKPEYQEQFSDNNRFGQNNNGPHFYFTIGSVETFESKMNEAIAEIPGVENVPVTYENRMNFFADILPWLIPLGLLFLFWSFMSRRAKGGGMGGGNSIFNIGKSKAKMYDREGQPKVTFDDVAGAEEAKEEMCELVSFLRDRSEYEKLGARVPKGVLLVGTPGTGKTLMAKAVAGEAEVPFFSISGSDFVEMFVGVGAARVRSLFQDAKKKAPCIIFIDEIDAIGRARSGSKSMQQNDERENTLNQLLQELDGFEPNSGIILIAATNRADILDKALMRPGRFDRQIHMDLPNLKEREAIYRVHLKDKKTDDTVDINLLASQSAGFSGADIANVCNEAALVTVRRKKSAIGKHEVMEAIDRSVAGLEKRSRIISDHEKQVIAYHEAGHAVVSKLLPNVDELVKVSIIPRGQSLGANWYLPKEQQLRTRRQFEDQICAALAGRAAEEIIFNEVSSGALNDLQKITKIAYNMVAVYGLNDRLGNVSYYDSSGESSFHKPYSEETGRLIDQEVKKITDTAYRRAMELLNANSDKLDKLAEMLLEKEVVYRKDLDQVFSSINGHEHKTEVEVNNYHR